MRAKAKRSVAAFAGVTFIMVLGNTMLFPVFPEMREALGLSSRQLAWLVLGISVPSALFAPIGGALADRFGRRVIILPSLWAYGLGGLGAGLAPWLSSDPFPWMLVGRVVQGMGSGAPMHLTMALVGDMFQSKERTKALGIVESANAFGKVSSPLIGAAVGILGWYAPFFVYPVAAALASIALWVWTDEPRTASRRHSWRHYERTIVQALERRHVVIAFGCALTVMFLLMGVSFWVADVLPEVRSMGRFQRGVVLSIPMLAASLVALGAQPVAEHLGVLRSLILGVGLLSAAVLALPFAAETGFLYPLLVGVGLGAGIALPELNTLATSSVPGEYRGAVTAVYGAVRSLGVAVAPSAFVALREHLDVLPFLLFGSLGILAMVAAFFIDEREALPAKLQSDPRR